MEKNLCEFAQDVYDVLAMNSDFCTQEEFFDKYVEQDNAFMIEHYKDKAVIYFDDYTITIEEHK